jgi:hypothetical protein
MNTHRILSALMAALAIVALASCGSPVERRIKRNPAAFSNLNDQDKAAVMVGKIREGLDKSAVLLAWGEPDRISEGKKNGRGYERWTYVEFDAVMSQPYGPPYAYHGHGVRADPYDVGYTAQPVVNYVPHEGATVEFVNGKVTGWAMPKR